MQADGRVGQITSATGSINPLRTNTEGCINVSQI